MNSKSVLNRNIVPAILIFCVSFLAYLPSLSGEFIWNDSDYVTAPELRSLDGLARIWIEPGATQQYYPLLHSAFWVQHRLFGDNPFGYHIVNILLHASAAVLFALVLRRLFGGDATPPGIIGNLADSKITGGRAIETSPRLSGVEWLAALIFALHPVHVESVAWITEQKNTLSLVFFLGAALAYLRFDRTRGPRIYLVALGLFVLSLWSKTVTATLPAVILVVFWWKRGRLDWRRDILPLFPWFVVGAVSGLFSSWVEHTYVGAQGVEFELSFLGRVLVAGRAVWFYLGKLILPLQLNFVYQRWAIDISVWWQWLYPVGAFAVGAVLWVFRKRARGPLAAYLIFVGTLFPVLGFVNLYGARYSWVWDHWQYLSNLALIPGIAMALAWTGKWLVVRIKLPVAIPLVAFTAILGTLSWLHCGMFRDNQTLYRVTIERNPSCWMAHYNLGQILSLSPGRINEAVSEYEETLRLKPDCVEAHNNLGLALMRSPGRLNEALAHFQEAVRLQSDSIEALNNLGNALAKIPGRIDEAIAQYKEALRLKPDSVEAHYNMGLALAKIPGRLADAIAQYKLALRLNPNSVETHNNLGLALAELPGHAAEAIAEFKEALRLKPNSAEAHYNLGAALVQMPGRLNDAITHYQEALRINPDYAEVHNNLGLALSQMPGRLNDAVAEYAESLRLQPESAEAHNNMGAALSQMPGRLNEAIAHYQEALRIKPDNAEAHNNLGLALVQLSGRLSEGVAQYEEALRLKPDYAEAYNNLGQAWARMPGRLGDAIEQYEKALSLNPNYAEAHNNLGVACARTPGRLIDAIAHFEEALRLKPDYTEGHYNLGLTYAKMPGRTKDAIAQFEAALRLNPNYVPAWHNLGVSWSRLGNSSASEAAFREVQRLTGKNPMAR